jgi:glyoxylase-like metal-dependent hydrolase (beta-lactamase superfamily II)
MPPVYRKWVEENLPPIEDRVILIKGDEKILPGISALSAPGHTPGQINLLIESENQKMLYLSDLLHFHFQTALPEVSTTADMDPTLASITRKKILQEVFAKDYLMQGFHLDFPGIGRLTKSSKFCWEFSKID